MAFAPVDYLALAAALHYEAKKDGAESKRRTAVSRAYYGAFLQARENAGISSKGRDGHERVIQHYHDAALANWLRDLKQLRVDADYDLAVTLTIQQSGAALKQATKVFTSLDPNFQMPK